MWLYLLDWLHGKDSLNQCTSAITDQHL